MRGIHLLIFSMALLFSAAHSQWVSTVQSFQPSQKLQSVAWSGSVFIAVGSGGGIYSSPDAITWTPSVFPVTGTLKAVIWGGGRFVAVGADLILTSSDGIAWVSQTLRIGSELLSVTWTGNQYVAVGGSGTGNRRIVTSPDAVTWTLQKNVPGSDVILYSVAWENNTLVAVGGYDGSTNLSTIYISTDGVDWTQILHHLKFTAAYFSVIWAHNQFVVCGYGGVVATSPDGMTWTERESGITTPLYASAWTGSQFVALGADGGFTSSPDGSSWTTAEAGTATQAIVHGMLWADSQLVEVGELSSKGAVVIAKPHSASGIRAHVSPITITSDRINSSDFSVGIPSDFHSASLSTEIFSTCGVKWNAVTPQVFGSRVTVPLSPLPAGKYFLEIQSAGKRFTVPFERPR